MPRLVLRDKLPGLTPPRVLLMGFEKLGSVAEDVEAHLWPLGVGLETLEALLRLLRPEYDVRGRLCWRLSGSNPFGTNQQSNLS